MDLSYSDEQRLLRDSADRFVADTYTAKHRATYASEPLGFSASIWKQFADLGWLAMPIGETHGGLGGGAVEIAILMEAFGRGLVSEPFLSTIVLGAGLIESHGREEQKQAILPAVARGEMFLAFAHAERAARSDHRRIDTTAKAAGNDWRIDGQKIAVLDGRAANTLIVSARKDNGDTGLFLVKPDAAGVTIHDTPRLGGGQACSIDFAGVTVSRSDELGNGSDAMPAIEAVIDRALAALCAEASGIMQVLLDRTLDYTKVRKQFGKPLAANQVVRHRLTDMSVHCDEARSMALRAALTLDAAPAERGRAASGAKAKVGKGARFVAEQSVQLHGAMGVTEELDVGAYFKRLLAFEMLLGSTTFHYRRHAILSDRAKT